MTTALVLSGGGSLGAVQAGMLLGLADAGIVPDLLVGTSVGALNAAYVAGRPWPAATAELAQIWRDLRRTDVFPTSFVDVGRAVTGRSDHLVSDKRLRELLRRHLTYARLQDAPTPLAVVATEVDTGREVVLSAGPAVDAVLASACLPGVFSPVVVDGHALIDGGLVDNAPVSVAVALGADSIIVLPTGYACALTTPPRGALGMALHAVTLAIQRRLIDEVVAMQDRVDLRVVPPLCPLAVSPVDFCHAADLIERARTGTTAWLARPRRVDQTAELLLHEHRRTPDPAGPPGDQGDRHAEPLRKH